MAENDDDAPLCQGPDPHPRAPEFAVPPGACDCHAHVLGPLALFPLQDDRSYTPPEAPLAQYWRMLEALGLERAVLVQPSVYGTDNRCMLQALALHRNTLRGVAVVSPLVSDEELEQLVHTGVRGLRINSMEKGGVEPAAIELLARRIEPFGGHLEIRVPPERLARLAPRLADLPVDIVIAHMAQVPAGEGIRHPGFAALLKLVRGGRCWVKLSAANRTAAAPPYHETLPFARALIETDPTLLLWGSDWPHVQIEGPMANDGALLDLLALWAPEPRLRHLILVENPARLYGFGE